MKRILNQNSKAGLTTYLKLIAWMLTSQQIFATNFVFMFPTISMISSIEKHWLKGGIVEKTVKRKNFTIFFSSCRASKDGSLSLFTKPFTWNNSSPNIGLKWFHIKGFVKSDKLPSFEARQELKNILLIFRLTLFLTLSWRRPLSYRNHSTDLQSKSMGWFLYDNGLRHERVNNVPFKPVVFVYRNIGLKMVNKKKYKNHL